MISPGYMLFFSRLSQIYTAVRLTSITEGQEASEYDQVEGKVAALIMKAVMMTAVCILMPVTTLGCSLLAGIYIAHSLFLLNLRAPVDANWYDSYLKKFWFGFRLLAISVAVAEFSFNAALYSGLLASSPMMLVATLLPFALQGLKYMLPPHTWYGKLLYAFDHKVAPWASALSLAFAPTSSALVFALNIIAASAMLYGPVRDVLSYISKRVFSLAILRVFNAIYRSPYMPSFIKSRYNVSFGRLYDELSAANAYILKKEQGSLSYAQMGNLINQNEIEQLTPTITSLYSDPRHGESMVLPAVTESQVQKDFREVLRTAFSQREDWEILLTQLAKKFPSMRADVQGLKHLGEGSVNQCRTMMLDYAEQDQIPETLAQNQYHSIVNEMCGRLSVNIKKVKAIIANPATQLGAGAQSYNDEKILPGLAKIFDKYLKITLEIERLESMPNMEDTIKQVKTRRANLLVALFDKSNRCQDALIGLIDEEDPLQNDPLKTAWVTHMRHQIGAVQSRVTEAFINEVSMGPGVNADGSCRKDQFRERLARTFALDPANVDNQADFEGRYIGRNPHDTFGTLTNHVFARHIDLRDFNPLRWPSSFFHHALYPRLFTAQTVENMVAFTQEIYAEHKSAHDQPQWLQQWDQKWQNYLDATYGGSDGSEIEYVTSPELLAAYEAQSDADKSAEALQNPDLSDEVKRNLAGDNHHLIGRMGNERTESLERAIGVDFKNMSLRNRREVLFQNKTMVRGMDLYPDLVAETSTKYDDNSLRAQKTFVSREFALVVLLSQGLIEPRQEIHDHLGRLGMIASCLHSEEQLQKCGYTF